MKNVIFSILVIFVTLFSASGQDAKLKVGMKVPEWMLPDADKKEFNMASWPGMVLQINYVDPDISDLNDPLNDAIKKAKDVDNRIAGDKFKGFGIVDCKSTWKPDFLIRTIAGGKAKKFNTTILFDYKGTLQDSWGIAKDNYTVVIVDKNRICRALYQGAVPESEFEKVINLIIQLGNE